MESYFEHLEKYQIRSEEQNTEGLKSSKKKALTEDLEDKESI